jgi:hypothetical protein
MIKCRCEPHASGSNRCILCKAEAQASARAEVMARTAASSLGIPAEPPPGHVPAPSYAPPVKTLESRVAELEWALLELRTELQSLRNSRPYVPMHGRDETYYLGRW